MITPQRTVDIALAILRKDILQGKYPPFTLLPSERKLSEMLSINRQTLRSALARLETERLVQPYHGRGIQVLNYKDTASIRILEYVATSKDLEDFFSLRKNLAAEAAALACSQATIHSLKNLRDIAIKQHSNTDIEDFFHGDLRFTTALVHASNSLPLRLLFNSFTKILHSQKEAALQSLSNREASLQSYMALIALIQNRDPILCRKAILLPTELTPEDQQQIQSALSREMNAE